MSKYNIDSVIRACKRGDDDFMDFEYIWEFINSCNLLQSLEALREFIPSGMLKYRLNEKIDILKRKS